MRQVPHRHRRGESASYPALVLSERRQCPGSLGDTRGGRSPVGTKARGREAAEEEEEAGLVTPQAGTASWHQLGSWHQLRGCLGRPPASVPPSMRSCSLGAGTDTSFPCWTQPYARPVPHPCGSRQPGADAQHSLCPVWQQDKGRLRWSSRALVPPGSRRGQRGRRRAEAGEEEEGARGWWPWGARGAEPQLWRSMAGGTRQT